MEEITSKILSQIGQYEDCRKGLCECGQNTSRLAKYKSTAVNMIMHLLPPYQAGKDSGQMDNY